MKKINLNLVEENLQAFLLLKDAKFVRHKNLDKGIGIVRGAPYNPSGSYRQLLVDWGDGLLVPESPELLEKVG